MKIYIKLNGDGEIISIVEPTGNTIKNKRIIELDLPEVICEYIYAGKIVKYIDNKLYYDDGSDFDISNVGKELLRAKRINLLKAFDIWEKAVLRGREDDSTAIMNWYRDLLDLKEPAFLDENIPNRIKYYM